MKFLRLIWGGIVDCWVFSPFMTVWKVAFLTLASPVLKSQIAGMETCDLTHVAVWNSFQDDILVAEQTCRAAEWILLTCILVISFQDSLCLWSQGGTVVCALASREECYWVGANIITSASILWKTCRSIYIYIQAINKIDYHWRATIPVVT